MKKSPDEPGRGMSGMLGNLIKAVVGVALLPVAVVIDVATIPWISIEDREATSPKIAKAVVKNIERAAGVNGKD